jgi:hypothetical protein
MLLLLTYLLITTGCEPLENKQSVGSLDTDRIYDDYKPMKVSFLPLTAIKTAQEQYIIESISAFVALHDLENSAVKSPGIFRFELYQYLVRSGEPKGKRIHIWPDIDLNDFNKNNEYWRDYLRAYEFKLDLDATAYKNYILELTCITPNGKRLINQYQLTKK